MTTETHAVVKSYYPQILLKSASSERYEKFYHDRFAAQQTIKPGVSYGDFFTLNPNFGMMKQQMIMIRKLSEGEIVVLFIFTAAIATFTLVPIMSGVNPILVLLLNGIWLLAYAFYAAVIVEDNKEHNRRTFANVLYPFTATVGITFIMSGYLHVSSWCEDEGTVYCAQITAHTECLINLRVKKTFKL